MKITNEDYKKLAEQKSPPSPLFRDILCAFIFGGIVCVIGQAISNYAGSFGLGDKAKSAITAISLIFVAAVLTGLNVFDNIAKIGGAGVSVPITGFSNAVVSPAMEFKSEGIVMGMCAKMFIIAGPVIVYGVLSSVIYGIILALIS